jgi:predicted transcriptional regulator
LDIRIASWDYGFRKPDVRLFKMALAARRDIAYTTVMTTMVRLAEKSILHREQRERYRGAPYRYTAVLQRQDVLLAQVQEVLDDASPTERQYVAAAILGVPVRV